MFLKGKLGLAFRMKRIKYKGKGPRRPASPDNEPNFYDMPPIGGNGVEVATPTTQRFVTSDNSDHAAVADGNSSTAAIDPLDIWEGQPIETLKSRVDNSFKGSPTSVVSGGNLSSLLDHLLSRSAAGIPPFDSHQSDDMSDVANDRPLDGGLYARRSIAGVTSSGIQSRPEYGDNGTKNLSSTLDNLLRHI